MIDDTKTLHVIMKTTENCNLECRYCYEGPKTRVMMEDDVLEASIDQLAEEALRRSKGKKTIIHQVWHGGEPLLRSRSFYESALEMQKRHGIVEFQNSIQTNAYLLDDNWVDFFLKNRFQVGSSLDGPKHINDISRVLQGGGSSFEAVYRNIRNARERGLRIGIITVIGKHNFEHMAETYEFFRDSGIDFEANMLTMDGNAAGDSIVIGPKEYGQAMIELFDSWFYDKSKDLPTASSFMKSAVGLITKKPMECISSGNCRDKYLAIEAGGDVYPCGRFGSHTPEYRLGNILTDNITDMIFSEPQMKLASRDIMKNDECPGCEYLSSCRGGCPYIALIGNGDINEPDFFCEGYKMIYSHVEDAIDHELARIFSGDTGVAEDLSGMRGEGL